MNDVKFDGMDILVVDDRVLWETSGRQPCIRDDAASENVKGICTDGVRSAYDRGNYADVRKRFLERLEVVLFIIVFGSMDQKYCFWPQPGDKLHTIAK